MSITNKVTIGFVSTILVAFSFAFVAPAAKAQQLSAAELQAKIQELQATLNALNTGSQGSVTTTVAGAACPYTWSRNLTIGSAGDDVRQLQRFLNGNPQTQVAVSGYGSPGNETTTYGPATKRAVAKFQELHAAQVLTPLGLTKGTGGFFNSTRKYANSLCLTASGSQSQSGVPKTPTVTQQPVSRVSVSGNAVAVTAGRHPGDSYAMQGAQRVPFTSFVLTAGSNDVRIEGIQVKQSGLASSDNFETVALVDANGVQVGKARSLNKDDEARLGSNLRIPRNSSMTLFLVGNITDTTADLSSGAVSTLEITNVAADVQVQGSFPIRGAAHIISDSVDLQEVDVTVSGGGDDVELNEDTEVAAFEIELDASGADEEDAYLKSITFEQIESADEEEIGDVTIYVDGEEEDYDLMIDGDRYVVTFEGQGVLVEEDDSIEISIEVNTDTGFGEQIQFAIDDASDIYVVGAKYGYGLPVDVTTAFPRIADASEILSGKVSSGSRVKGFEDEIVYGDDKVIGALAVEFEGEDILVEGMDFSAQLTISPVSSTYNPWDDAEEDDVSLDNVYLMVDGEKVAYASDDVIFEEFATGEDGDEAGNIQTVTFDDEFEIDVRSKQDVLFEIVADLDSAWSHFDGAQIELKLTSVDKAEGVSSEKDFTGSGEFFATERAFRSVDIIGNVIEFEIADSNIDDASRVAGSSDVNFGTLIVDASDAVDAVELKDAWLSFTPGTNSDLGDLDNCRITEDGDEVADSRGSLSGTTEDQIRFKFDRYVVDAGSEVDLDVLCDIDDGADANDSYTLATDASGDPVDKIEYLIGSDEFEYVLLETDDSQTISVSESGSLEVSFDNPDEDADVFAVATGSQGIDDIPVLEIEFEAEEEDVKIIDLYLAGITLPAGTAPADAAAFEAALEKLLDSVWFEIGGSKQTARPRDYEASKKFDLDNDGDLNDETAKTHLLEFENVNKTVPVDEEETIVLKVDLAGIDENDGQAGQYLQAAEVVIVWEGQESDDEMADAHAISAGTFTKAIAFPTVPTVSVPNQPSSAGNLTDGNDKELYQFTVTADDEGDLYLDQVAFDFNVSNGVTLSNIQLRRGSTPIATMSGTITANAPNQKFPFVISSVAKTQEIKRGDSRTFSLYATIAGAADDKSVTVKLSSDSEPATAAAKIGRAATAVKGDSHFVWSPNALDTDGSLTSLDWFGGWSHFKSSEIDSWTRD